MGSNAELEGVNSLARVLTGQMKKTGESPLVLDFGIVQGDYSLKTNTFPLPIPKTDYLICRNLTRGVTGDVLTQTKQGQGNHPHGSSGSHGGHDGGDGAHGHPGSEGIHVHDVLLPENMRSVKPGDRVLVAWVGHDAVVMDIIYNASEVRFGG